MILQAISLALTCIGALAQQSSWRLANGTQGLLVHDVEPYPGNPDSVYALVDSAGPKLLVSTDRGEHWRMVMRDRRASIITGSIKPDATDSRIVYLSYSWENLRGRVNTSGEMTSDGGSTWISLGSKENPAGSPSAVERNPLAPQAIYVGIGYGFLGNTGYGQIVLTRNEGQHWDTLFFRGAGPEAMAIAPSDTNVMYQGYSGSLYKTTDSGLSWGPRMSVTGWISDVAIHPQDHNKVYLPYLSHLGHRGGVSRTTDGGISWFQSNSGLGDTINDVNAISINPKRPSELFLATSLIPCHRSTNGGDSWSRFDIGFPFGIHGVSITLDTVVQRIYLGTTAGIYINDLVTQAPPTTDQHPKRFELGQNYPNPFNPSTTIEYNLPVAAHVTLKLYDILGQEVMTLVDEQAMVGYHSAVLDASRLSSGVYFYRMQAGAFGETKKLLLLR